MQHWTQVLNNVGRNKQQKDQKKKEEENTRADVYVGMVESVNPDGHFVLIRHTGVTDVSVGAVLVVRDKGGSQHGTLTVGPERKQNFISADITTGTPRVRDSVYLPAKRGLAGRKSTFTMSPVDLTPPGAPGPMMPQTTPGGNIGTRGSGWQEMKGPASAPNGMVPGVAPTPGSPPPGEPSPGLDLPPPVR